MSLDTHVLLDRKSENKTDVGHLVRNDRSCPIVVADLEAALACSEFELYLQPIVRLADGKIKGFEALTRWQRPGHGMVMPSDFIPLLETTELIFPFGAWVVREACRILREWQLQHPAAEWLSLNINLSARQFEDPFLFETISGLVEDAGLQPSFLRLEVTESLMMRNPERAAEVLRRFAALGFGVSLDDFGTGYSSLSYLHGLPVDSLKIDRCFVTGLEVEGGNLRIVRAILGLAASLGLSVVAEGIENAQQAALLGRLGCSYGQGYYFARPLPVHDAAMLLGGRQARRLHQTASIVGDPPAGASVVQPRSATQVWHHLALAMTGSAEQKPKLSEPQTSGAPGSPDGLPASRRDGTKRTDRFAVFAPFAMAPVFMALHAGFVTALPGTRDIVTSLCEAVGPTLASAACWRASLVDGAELRPNWLLAALAFLFWASGSLLSVWIPTGTAAGPVDFLSFLCSMALVLALTVRETDRPRHLFLLLDGLQALLGAVLGYVVIFGAVPFSSQQLRPLSISSTLSIYDVENASMAILASLRFFGSNASCSRQRFDHTLLLFTLVFGILGSAYDHIAPSYASALDVMLDPAFFLVFAAAGSPMGKHPQTDRTQSLFAAFIDSLGPVFPTAAIFLVGIWIARQQLVMGIVSILIAVAIYALRASLLHARCLVTQQDLRQAKHRLERLSLEDGLTEVGNRRAFDAALSTFWADAERTGATLAVLLVDVDFFKNYNDRHGHLMGDICLVRIAEVLRDLTNPKCGFVARYGGEEFAVLLPTTSARAALATASRARQAIASLELVNHSGISAPVTVSIGLSVSTQLRSTDALLLEADDALYRAKRKGRDRVEAEAMDMLQA